MHNNKPIQLINLLEKDTLEKIEVVLNGSGTQALMLRPAYTGFVSYQVSDPDSTLSGSLAINLEMSNDGETWTEATDASGEVISQTIAAGESILEKLSDVNPAIKLRLAFASTSTGTIKISTRI